MFKGVLQNFVFYYFFFWGFGQFTFMTVVIFSYPNTPPPTVDFLVPSDTSDTVYPHSTPPFLSVLPYILNVHKTVCVCVHCVYVCLLRCFGVYLVGSYTIRAKLGNDNSDVLIIHNF